MKHSTFNVQRSPLKALALISAFQLFSFSAFHCAAQPSPVAPATQAEVNAGAVTRKYVSPATLAGWPGGGGGGSVNTNVFRLTNELGNAINVISAGVVANSLAASNANTVILSNLFNAGGTYFIPDAIYHNPIVIQTNAPQSLIYGYGLGSGSALINVGATNTWGIRAYQYAPKFVGIKFNYSQAVPQTPNTNHCYYVDAVSTFGGGLWVNAVGPGLIKDCEFRSIAGTAIYYEGFRDILSRSNALKIINNNFFGNYNGSRGGKSNATEFTEVAGNFFATNTAISIEVWDANNSVHHNICMGSMDGPFTNGVASAPGTLYGFPMISFKTFVDSRVHSDFDNNTAVHGIIGFHIDGRPPSGTINGAGFQFRNNSCGGNQTNYAANFLEADFTGTKFEATGGSTFTNILNLNFDGVTVQGAGIVNNGQPNVLPFWTGRVVGSSGEHTNNYIRYFKGGQLGSSVFVNSNANIGLGDYPSAVQRTVIGQFDSAYQTPGFVYANAFWASNYIGFPYRAAFRPADSSGVFSITGNDMVLSGWDGLRHSLGVSNLHVSGSILISGSLSNSPLAYLNLGTLLGGTRSYLQGSLSVQTDVVTQHGYYFGSGTGITNLYLTNATLNFPSVVAGTASYLTINLTNVAPGDFVNLVLPIATRDSVNPVFSKWDAFATNGFIVIEFCNQMTVSAQDPASGDFRVEVRKLR